MNHPGNPRFGGPAARISGQGDRPGGSPVVASPAGVDLVPPRVPAGRLDGVFNGFGPRVGEEHVIQIRRSHLGNHGGQTGFGLGAESRGDIAELLHLRFHGLQHMAVAVADIDVEQTGTTVDIAFAVRIPHVDSFGPVDHDRIYGSLSLPAVNDMLAIQFFDFLCVHVSPPRMMSLQISLISYPCSLTP